MFCLQFSLLSKVNPKYLTYSVGSILMSFICTGVHVHFRRVKVVFVDLNSITLIFILFDPASMRIKLSFS
jgi:hypothetical protein